MASGFRKVTDDFEPSLYHVKGKRTTVVKELPKVRHAQNFPELWYKVGFQ